MRLARFCHRDSPGFGVVNGDHVVALNPRVPCFGDLIENPHAAVIYADDPRIDLDEVSWLPPFEDTAKILCVGFNYSTHSAEGDRRAGDYPTLFVRFTDSFVGSGHCVAQEADTHTLDWEGEVALVIGRGGRAIATEDAWDHIAGLTALAENSERMWQMHSNQATAGKNWTRSGACGPWITTIDEVGRGPVELTTKLNGTVVQHDSTANLTFGFAELVSYISTFTQLRPGDVISTGTPSGLGYRQDPPRYLTVGDELEVTVSRVGTLRHGVIGGPITSASDLRSSPRDAHRPSGGSA